MSNFEPLSSQPGWHEQYSPFPLSGESGLPQSSFEQSTSLIVLDTNGQPAAARSQLEHRHSIGPLRDEVQSTTVIERPDSAPVDSGAQTILSRQNHSVVSTDPSIFSLGSFRASSRNAASNITTQQGLLTNNSGDIVEGELKDEDDDEDDDDEILDSEEGGNNVPQTAAERRAECRKMKRFRLTHQQTRFLMSEFAKQAHPNAAHRERLSREIPGLSPRQVQVWFQNSRRAKIKRLTADDRERMMKMRAVPDDFDNVQALHSPYGAVHGIGTSLQSPVDFSSGYSDHMMRPLMVDTMRRNDHNDHVSPTGISPAFGHVGFGHGEAIGGADVLSPLSMNSSDRYYPTHSTPLSAGSRNSNPFDRQNSYQGLSHPRQHVRPLQPLQLQTLSRTRSESLQSPLRTSMSWKGDTLDYGHYQTGQSSPQLSGRHQSVYQADQAGAGSANSYHFDGSTYSGPNLQRSPTELSYSQTHGSSSAIQQSPSALSRLRASSTSTFPTDLDLRDQYQRGMPQHSPQAFPTPRSSSLSNAYSSGFASAPLSAPADFQLPRTPMDGPRDFSIPQLSAPIQAPQDFQSAYNSGASHSRQTEPASSGQSQQPADGNQSQGQTDQQQQQHKVGGETSYLSPVRYDDGQTRKRRYTLPGQYDS
ncbi:hypothetical protein BJ878DRAFT_420637 [Calycina marina]|uniref:Homeobox domain-containing protein n=1 Tax=Calycina marina TaxID=1763456 RepID=A0A9P7Z3T1_9HELO|nr:hypothetical protein BJ878DRAFT_420637 [Calycina marina]